MFKILMALMDSNGLVYP